MLAQLGAGRNDALTPLYQHYGGRVRQYAFSRLGNLEDANEVTDDTFMFIAQAPERFDYSGKFLTFLIGITKNKCLDMHRRRERHQKLSDAVSAATVTVEAATNDLLDALEAEERSSMMRDCIAKLPPSQKEALLLVINFGYAMQEIADAQDCPQGTVKSRLAHARQKVTECVKRKLEGGTDE